MRRSGPAPDSAATRPPVDRSGEPLLRVRGLVKHFAPGRGTPGRRGRVVRAVEGLDLDVWPGETLALVGESGCGKSTTARAVLRLVEPTSGEVRFDGQEVAGMGRAELRAFRRRAQIVFQDPGGALNPRMTAEQALAETLSVHGRSDPDPRGRVVDLLERVGLGPEQARSYPHELSGGQRQRLGIARALAVEPELLVLDEPVSALDVSVRAQVVNLLLDLQRDLGLAYLFIAHDLPLVGLVSDRVAVMYLGRVVETGPTPDVFRAPVHPYTSALLSSAPGWHTEGLRRGGRLVLGGEPPSPTDPPPGCVFHPRCPHPRKDEACSMTVPGMDGRGPGRFAACIKASVHP